jgi:hypothetical protein
MTAAMELAEMRFLSFGSVSPSRSCRTKDMRLNSEGGRPFFQLPYTRQHAREDEAGGSRHWRQQL